jgi:branched-chain amino acid transport system permease protein
MNLPSAHELANALIAGLLLGGLFAVTALGLSLVFGVMRLINLVHGELIVLGAYLSLELMRRTGLDPLLTIVVVAPALFLVAVPIQRLLLEPLQSKGAEPALLTT